MEKQPCNKILHIFFFASEMLHLNSHFYLRRDTFGRVMSKTIDTNKDFGYVFLLLHEKL